MIPKFGLFTPYTLRFHSEYYNEDSNAFLKRCFVLFDQMTYLAPRSQDAGFIERIVNSGVSGNSKELLKSFLPVSEFVSNDFISEIGFKVNPRTNLWYGPNGKEFKVFIENFLSSKFGLDARNIKSAEEFEMLDYYVTALSADFNYLFQLSEYNNDFSALYTELHKDAYFATYKSKTSVPERVLKKVCSINLFDFGQLTWDQIYELKESHFLKDFRIKSFEWVKEYDTTEDEVLFEKNIDKFLKMSNFSFLESQKPDLKKKIAQELIGSIVMPYNPMAIYSSLEGIHDEWRKKKDFGWLFFIQESYSKSNETINNE